uniref:V-type proton ATPase subunit G n=1 Tax=Vombatus ursinus TaxID=29139 RepID=A0A4X2KKX6_VOMUR
MASKSQGIQQLLQAEKSASEKIAEARRRKFERLKRAKKEAQNEVEKYRLKREEEFKAKELETLGSHSIFLKGIIIVNIKEILRSKWVSLK